MTFQGTETTVAVTLNLLVVYVHPLVMKGMPFQKTLLLHVKVARELLVVENGLQMYLIVHVSNVY